MAVENTRRLLPFLRVHQVWADLSHQAVLVDSEYRDLKIKDAELNATLIAQLEEQYAEIMRKREIVRLELSEIYAAMNFFQVKKVIGLKFDIANTHSDPENDKILLEKINKYSEGAYATLFQLPSTSSDDENNIRAQACNH